MILKYLIISFILIIVNCQNYYNSDVVLDESTLKLVHVTVRNGEHYPDPWMMTKYPKYERKNKSFGPHGAGELTKEGRETMYDVGKKLKKKYGKFLYNANWHLMEYLVKSLGLKGMANRSLESALIMKEGLGETDRESAIKREWSEQELNKVQNDDFDKEAMYYMKECSRFKKLQNQALRKFTKKFKEQHEVLYYALKKHAKWNTSDPSNLYHIFELYAAERNAGLKNPEWLTDGLYEQFRGIMDEYVKESFSTTVLRKIGGGLIVDSFFEQIDLMQDGEFEPCFLRMFLYAGNGGTLAPQFAAFGGETGFIFKDTKKPLDVFYPEHGSAFIVETHKPFGSDYYYVKFFYSPDLESQIYEIEKLDCPYPCGVITLAGLMEDTVTNYIELANLCSSKKSANSKKAKVAE